MKNLLEDFWYGNIIPHEQFIGNTPEIKKLNDYILRHRETLHESMTPEQKAILEKYDDCLTELHATLEKDVFIYAFRLGSRFTLASLI